MLAGGIGNELSEQGQGEGFGNLDIFRGTQRQVGDAETADLVVVRPPGHKPHRGIPVAGDQAEGGRQLEVGAEVETAPDIVGHQVALEMDFHVVLSLHATQTTHCQYGNHQ